MRNEQAVPPWLLIITALGSGCAARLDDNPARQFAVQGASAPASCTSDDVVDDRCTLCQKGRCCREVEACDADCRTWYRRYEGCLYTDGIWSGTDTAECMKETQVDMNPAAYDLIQCFRSKCATESYCGAEPRAAFAPAANADRILLQQKPQSPAHDFSAAQFLERYCNGCHQPQTLAMAADGTPLTNFTSSFDWFGPSWYQSMDYEAVRGKVDIVACGVRADFLPPECSTLTSVRQGFFTAPAKFPPAHPPSAYGGCFWSAGRCLLPTSFERARLLSWIADGAPE